MIDRENVIKGLEECAGNGKCTKCQYRKEKQTLSCKKLLADALELIKSSRTIHTEHALYTIYERHNEEQNDCENCAIAIEDRQLVVRCKDCDNKKCWDRAGNVVCGIDGNPHKPDYFCAYGKKKRSAL